MNTPLSLKDILAWLCEENPDRLKTLWAWADEIRRLNVGDTIHLRGLVEISSRCIRQCAYCGLRVGNHLLTRYRMEPEEILESARQAVSFGYGTVVLQAKTLALPANGSPTWFSKSRTKRRWRSL